MANRDKSRKATTGKPLPINRESLAYLLGDIHKFVDIVERFQQRQRIRAETMRHMLLDPNAATLKWHSIIKASHEESSRQWAKGIPNVESILPYLDTARFFQLSSKRKRAMELLHDVTKPRNSEQFTLWIERHQAVIDIDDEILGLFKGLQSQILVAIEDGADARADTKKFFRLLPTNDQVLGLYRRIEENDDPTLTQRQIAKDFTEEQSGNPDSLLRAVRRFRKRLRTI